MSDSDFDDFIDRDQYNFDDHHGNLLNAKYVDLPWIYVKPCMKIRNTTINSGSAKQFHGVVLRRPDYKDGFYTNLEIIDENSGKEITVSKLSSDNPEVLCYEFKRSMVSTKIKPGIVIQGNSPLYGNQSFNGQVQVCGVNSIGEIFFQLRGDPIFYYMPRTSNVNIATVPAVFDLRSYREVLSNWTPPRGWGKDW